MSVSVPLHGLPFEDRLWLARHGEEVVAEAGNVLFEEGATANRMILILKGEIHVRRQHGGPMALFIGRTGQMTGLLPFSRMKSYGGQGFAVSPRVGHSDSQGAFSGDAQRYPVDGAAGGFDAAGPGARSDPDRAAGGKADRALGKLAGNLAHELNNPASAAQRAASSLVTELRANRQNRFKLVNLCLNEEQIRGIEDWEQRILSRPTQHGPPDAQCADCPR